MLSNGFDAPLRLKLDPSRLLIQFQLLVHVLAIIAISLPSSVPLAIKLILYVYVVYSAVRIQYEYKSAGCELFVWQKSTQWLEVVDGKETFWSCQTGNLVLSWFVIVTLTSENRRRRLLIIKDQCDAQSFRRLRVKLKYFQGEAAMPTDAS